MRADIVSGLLFIGLAVFFYSVNWQTGFAPMLGDPGSKLMPSIVAIVMGVLGAGLVAQALFTKYAQSRVDELDRQAPPSSHQAKPWGRLAVVALLLLYVALLPYGGYALCTFLFFFAASLSWGERSRRAGVRYAIVAFVVTALTYYALSLGLNISLPSGFWETLSEQPYA